MMNEDGKCDDDDLVTERATTDRHRPPAGDDAPTAWSNHNVNSSSCRSNNNNSDNISSSIPIETSHAVCDCDTELPSAATTAATAATNSHDELFPAGSTSDSSWSSPLLLSSLKDNCGLPESQYPPDASSTSSDDVHDIDNDSDSYSHNDGNGNRNSLLLPPNPVVSATTSTIALRDATQGRESVQCFSVSRNKASTTPQQRRTDQSKPFQKGGGRPLDIQGYWDKMYQQLVHFYNRHGHLRIPRDCSANANKTSIQRLGNWLHQQKSYYCRRKMRGLPTALIDERLEKLRLLGFKIDNIPTTTAATTTATAIALLPNRTPRGLDQRWNDKYDQLVAFHKIHGHLFVSDRLDSGTNHDMYKLGVWLCSQRKYYRYRLRGIKSSLTDERLEKLNRLGFQTAFNWNGAKTPHKSATTAHLAAAAAAPPVHVVSVDKVSPFPSSEQTGSRQPQHDLNSSKLFHSQTAELKQPAAHQHIGQTWMLVNNQVIRNNIGTKNATLQSDSARFIHTSTDTSATETNDDQVITCDMDMSESESSSRPSSAASTTTVDAQMRQLEVQLLNKLDNAILAAEEKEILDGLELDVAVAEDRMWYEQWLGRPVGILTDPDPEDTTWKPQNRRRNEHPDILIDCEEIVPLKKGISIVPKRVNNNSETALLITSEELSSITKQLWHEIPLDKRVGFSVRLDDVPNETNSCRLVVSCHQDVWDIVWNFLRVFCKAKVNEFNYKMLLQTGVEVVLQLDRSAGLGVVLSALGNDVDGLLMKTITSNTGELAKALGIETVPMAFGAAVVALDGEPCLSIDNFKQIKSRQKGSSYKLTLRINESFDLSNLNMSMVLDGPTYCRNEEHILCLADERAAVVVDPNSTFSTFNLQIQEEKASGDESNVSAPSHSYNLNSEAQDSFVSSSLGQGDDGPIRSVDGPSKLPKEQVLGLTVGINTVAAHNRSRLDAVDLQVQRSSKTMCIVQGENNVEEALTEFSEDAIPQEEGILMKLPHDGIQDLPQDSTPQNEEIQMSLPQDEMHRVAEVLEHDLDGKEGMLDAKAVNAKHFHSFGSLVSALAKEEFGKQGIPTTFVIRSMWRRHKTKFGNTCGDSCLCFRKLPFLTKNVVKDYVKKHPDRLPTSGKKAVEYPVGIAKNFASNFVDLLCEEYPSAGRTEIIRRLFKMWDVHRRNLTFGIRCGPNCSCAEGWEELFNKGNPGKRKALIDSRIPKKRRSDHHIIHPATSDHDTILPASIPLENCASLHNANWATMPIGRKQQVPRRSSVDDFVTPIAAQNENKQRKEYCVKFNAQEPLGFFCTTNSDNPRRCFVFSVSPQGQCRKDVRIQNDSTVVGAGYTDIMADRQELTSHEDLQSIYEFARRNRSRFFIWFINSRVTAESVSITTNLARADWTLDGHWRGAKMNGWDGRTLSSDESTQVESLRVQDIRSSPERDEVPTVSVVPEAHIAGATDVWTRIDYMAVQGTRSSSKRNESLTVPVAPEAEIAEATDTWTVIDYMAPLPSPSYQPKSIRGWDKDKTHIAPRNVRFAGEYETRRYDVDSRTCEFQVPSGSSLSTQNDPNRSIRNGRDRLIEAIQNGTYDDLLYHLEDGALADVISVDDVIASMRTVVKERKESLKFVTMNTDVVRCLEDLDRKETILKVYAHANHSADIARSLKYWNIFEITILQLDLIEFEKSFQDTALARGGDVYGNVFVVFEKEKKTKAWGMLKAIPFSRTIVYEPPMNLTTVKHNRMTATRSIKINLVFEGADGEHKTLSTTTIALQDIHQKCPNLGEKRDMVFDLDESEILLKGKVMIQACRLTLETQEIDQKRTRERGRINEVSEWIERFNKDIGLLEDSTQRLISADVKVKDNVTLLQSAILLEDDALVEKLLWLGANPATKSVLGTALCLAQNMRDAIGEGPMATRELLHSVSEQAECRTVPDLGDLRQKAHHKRLCCIVSKLRRHLDFYGEHDADQSTTGKQSDGEGAVSTQRPKIAQDSKPASGESFSYDGPSATIVEWGECENYGISTERSSSPIGSVLTQSETEPGKASGIDRKRRSSIVDEAIENVHANKHSAIAQTPKVSQITQINLLNLVLNKKPCWYFEKQGYCKFGSSKCRNLHIAQSVGQPTMAGVWAASQPSHPESQLRRDIKSIIAQNWDGDTRYSVVYQDPITKMVYFPEAGPGGEQSPHYIWWYRTLDEAEIALYATMAVSLGNRGCDHCSIVLPIGENLGNRASQRNACGPLLP